MPALSFSYLMRTRVVFGNEAVSLNLPQILKEFLCSRALIISDPGVVEAGLAGKVKNFLQECGFSADIFSDVEPDPGLATVDEAAKVLRRFKPDCLLAVGGGSSIDVAKAARVLYAHGGNISDYVGVNKVKGKPVLPLLAVPTTAGTGSEVTGFAVLSDWEQNIKVTISSEHLAPDVAIVDPSLMVTAPPGVTAASGIDALSHAVEAFVSKATSPVSDALALKAVKIITVNLIPAIEGGYDLLARTNMALGSLLAGMAFNNAFLGLTHSIGAALSGHAHVGHGMAVGLMLPHVMEYNIQAVPDKFVELAGAMGEQTESCSPDRTALAAPRAVKELVRRTGLPVRLKEIGIPQGALEAIAETALKHGMIKFNPRVPTRAEILGIVQRAF